GRSQEHLAIDEFTGGHRHFGVAEGRNLALPVSTGSIRAIATWRGDSGGFPVLLGPQPGHDGGVNGQVGAGRDFDGEKILEPWGAVDVAGVFDRHDEVAAAANPAEEGGDLVEPEFDGP